MPMSPCRFKGSRAIPRSRGGGGGQAYSTFPLHITCNKRKGAQMACKNAYVINERSLVKTLLSLFRPDHSQGHESYSYPLCTEVESQRK